MKKLDLGKDNINKLLLTFSLPCIVSMLINSIYNIVDQIFIGQGVGYVGNAATNVIFPFVIICNGIANLLGTGCAAGLSLRLGAGKKEEAKKLVGSTITTLLITAVIFSIISYILLPELINIFGCTENVYKYAYDYGRIIVLGAPFMIIYTGLTAIIRADNSPKYSMSCLLVGAIINLILDPIFIFKFNMGVKGGALATIIGQIISSIMAIMYIPKIKTIDLKKNDFIPDKSIFKILGYGASSFITQMTILVLFVYMNNIMTKYGKVSEFGGDIPLSVYGVASKLNGLYVSSVLGVAIGAQPILGFNYGAGNNKRVKETLKKVLIINFIIGIIFNLLMILFPSQIVSLFGSKDNNLYLKFATDFLRIFLMLSFLNAFEMTSSIVIQSLGSVKKATFVAFSRQIILFIPISLILTKKIGLYGALYAGPIADSICFIIVIFVYNSVTRKIFNNKEKFDNDEKINTILNQNRNVVVTISREYGSGGRYVGKLLSEKLGVKFYDKEIINLISKESGYSKDFIYNNEQSKTNIGGELYNLDDNLFKYEEKVILEVSKNPCVIVGRCSDYILKNKKNVIKIFLYSDLENKINRGVKYYGLSKEEAKKKINKVNKDREKYHKYFCNQNYKDLNNYDLFINVDKIGIDKTVELIKEYIDKRFI